jgi:thiopeptide-type bacteriocin biosynthesis protein
VLDDLTTAGHVARWWPTIYEPESAAFGSATGMSVVHDLFCADSRGVLDHLRHDIPSLGRRELSVLLLTGLFHNAGLDAFERGDVFDRVTQLRPVPAGVDTAKIDQLAATLRAVVMQGDPSRTNLFDVGGPAAHAVDWLAAFQHAGHQFGDAAAHGRLRRGLRAILTHVVIFHWNRLGLSATSQAVLARAATTALLPGH